MHVIQIAQVCHEANRVLQEVNGDPINPHWHDTDVELRESAIHGVEVALEGATPQELHEAWCDSREGAGWVYGPVKNMEEKIHPCLVPYDELPPEQKIKDALFSAIVLALAE